jgi:inhibitor of KinA sporulation pathway (predicted exonuclease)
MPDGVDPYGGDGQQQGTEVQLPTNRFAALLLEDHDGGDAKDVEDEVAGKPRRLTADFQKFEQHNRLRMDDAIRRGLLFGKVHTAEVRGHSPAGFIVDVQVADTASSSTTSTATPSSSDDADDGATTESQEEHCAPPAITIRGVVKWHKPTIVRWPSVDKRVRVAVKRVPVGSRFGVYSGGICDYSGDLRLRVATKPNPVFNTSTFNLNKLKEQPFRYLIIMDLEATCDFCLRPIVDASVNSEIIEFPWVVLDTRTLEIVHEERYFVRPDFLEGVTPYCSALTGISRDMVAQSMRLQDVLSKFHDYVEDRFADVHLGHECKSFRILTDGMWDVHIQLAIEAQRKDIALPWWFKEYFDLKVEFDRYFPYFITNKHGQPLHLMLKALGLPFVGRHHSGLDDCKTIVQIVQYLLKLGHVFDQPTKIEKPFDPLEESWNKFSNVPTGDAWQCPGCALWNKAFAKHYCAFCKAPKP